MSFESLLDSFSLLFNSFLNLINSVFKLFFNDLPVIFGLRLGWWFILFGIFAIFSSFLKGGD